MVASGRLPRATVAALQRRRRASASQSGIRDRLVTSPPRPLARFGPRAGRSALERLPAIEAQVYRPYGSFRCHLAQDEEARAYLERVGEVLDSLGEVAERATGGRVEGRRRASQRVRQRSWVGGKRSVFDEAAAIMAPGGERRRDL